MAKRSTEMVPVAVAALVAALSGAVLLLTRKKDDGTDGAPDELPTCDPGTAYNASTGLCEPLPQAGNAAAAPPSWLPNVKAASGPVFPPHGRLLIVGGEIAKGLADALMPVLEDVEKSAEGDGGPPIPSSPEALVVWDGAPVFYQFEEFAAGLRLRGVPEEAATMGGHGRPDVVIVVVGEYNAKWGPVDEGTRAAITTITNTFADLATDHYPNVLFLGPINRKLPHAFDLAVTVPLVAMSARPLRSYFLSPKDIELVDDMRPSPLGYVNLAKQVARVLLSWYLQPHGGTGA